MAKKKTESAEVKTDFDAEKEYKFRNTYVGKYGVFHEGKSYRLTEEQYNVLRTDLCL